ncbi:MAG: restriction endonuclease, partial [Eubacteriales bacterium]|nr:restriction endonuclease [Eubacteriales bacterium]
MEKYRQKTPVASFADHLLRGLVAACVGIGWFVYLWGLSLPALSSGLAMGGLLWLLARMLGKKRVIKREDEMRRMLGGEMALEKLLLLPPRHAAFQVALWLAPKAPVEMQRAVEWGVVGMLNGKRILIRLICVHPSLEISVQQVIEAVKEAHEHQSERCFLCVTAPMSKAALHYAEASSPEIRLVSREELARLAGACSPATDEDLVLLRKRKKKRH